MDARFWNFDRKITRNFLQKLQCCTYFMPCDLLSKDIKTYNHETQRYQSSDDRTVSILPALVSFGLLNRKDDVASKASNGRLVIFNMQSSFCWCPTNKLSLHLFGHSNNGIEHTLHNFAWYQSEIWTFRNLWVVCWGKSQICTLF